MCGRMSLFVPPSVLEERFDVEAVARITPRYNVAPGDDLATIPNDRPGEIDGFRWGLVPDWVDDVEDWPSPINARAETVAEKPAFRDAFAERRCLVLADGFYEWQGERGRKQPYRIERADDEPFAFAGLWQRRGEDGDAVETVAIVTTEANDVVAPIHDRMPAMLEPDEEDRWLAGDDADDLHELLDPYPDDLLDVYPISKRVNDPANDSPDVVEPIDVGEQSGLDEFAS